MKKKWAIGITVVVIALIAAHLLIHNTDPAGFVRELHGM